MVVRPIAAGQRHGIALQSVVSTAVLVGPTLIAAGQIRAIAIQSFVRAVVLLGSLIAACAIWHAVRFE